MPRRPSASGSSPAWCPVDELDAAVDELAAELASRSPLALRQGRDSFYAVWDQDVEASLRLLHPLLTITASTEDAAEGIAAFNEKRPPSGQGRLVGADVGGVDVAVGEVVHDLGHGLRLVDARRPR